jgi:hypothetical protein
MRRRDTQRGITLVVIAIAMVALIAMAGLAIDIARLVSDKARLQSVVDAAALTAAKVLDTTGSTAAATAAANNVFVVNTANQPDLARAFGRMAIEYSNTVAPFIAGNGAPLYAQVTAAGYGIFATFSRVLGFNFFILDASAIAGPSPTMNNACNMTPMLVCGAPSTPAAPVYGYAVNEIIALQLSAGTPATLGPGYFLQQNSGVYSQDQDFAGAYSACSTVGNNDPGQTGAVPTAAADGLDTRFNEYQGDLNQADYPPDAVVTQPPVGSPDRLTCQAVGTNACGNVVDGGGTITNSGQYGAYSYEGMYQPDLQAGNYTNPPAPAGNGVVDRRVLAVPVVDCGAAGAGGGNVPVLGLACMFMLQDVDPVAGQVFVEVISNCEVNGTPGPVPNNGPGPYSIQLYHSPFSTQS